ncbi:hypothetical protein KP509_34G062500 [Ceratopteris richardii]|uniref:Sulfite exporter TauE/SafE family protein n=1 Tax=Ceratopteris richardii TaxID=49495 RepID=A0A8T2QM79_CERRI|nr:hypothetical protein KP509_34G062500 [Ceratopteris richardii]
MDWYATGPHATIMQALQATYIPPGCLGRVSIELQIWRVIIAIVCGALAATLASAGGIGGGGLYVPIFNLLLGLNSNTSAALSSCMILGGTSVNLVWYSFRRREDGLGPLIDYQVSLLCLPNVLLGITAGVICNVASPSWLITVLLIIVLSLMTYRCFRNAFGRWNCETSALHSVNIRSGSAKDAGCDYVVDNDVFESCDNVSDQKCRNEELEKPLLEYSEMRRQPQYPLLKITSLLLVWVVFLAVQVVRGSSDNQVGLSISCFLGLLR